MLPNDMKLIIHVIDSLYTDSVVKKNKAISSVANTIKIFHIHKNMQLLNKQDLYKDKQKEKDELFIEYISPIMDDLDHTALV